MIAAPDLTLTRRYDLRTAGKVTPVKSQQWSTCWAYATFDSLESVLLPAETWDFSEAHMDRQLVTNGYVPFSRDDVAPAGYLGGWFGPVKETDFHPGSDPSAASARKHLQAFYRHPIRQGPLDNDWIKGAILLYGAPRADLFWDPGSFNGTWNSYYQEVAPAASNHAVALVGWDDDFSRFNFTPGPSGHPVGDGAFIFKNNWGTGWGEGGYGYLSYYSDPAALHTSLYIAESRWNYSRIYQHDPLGWTGQALILEDPAQPSHYYNTRSANVFTAEADSSLAAVSFWAGVLIPPQPARYDCRIDVHRDPVDGPLNPIGPALTFWTTTELELPGYFTVAIVHKVRSVLTHKGVRHGTTHRPERNP